MPLIDLLNFLILLVVSSLIFTIVFGMPTHVGEFIYYMSLGYHKPFFFFLVITTVIVYLEGCTLYATRLVNKMARESLCFFFLNSCFYVAVLPRILYIIHPEATTFYIYCILFENLVYHFMLVSLIQINLHLEHLLLYMAEPEIQTYSFSYLIGFIIFNALFSFCWVWPNHF